MNCVYIVKVEAIHGPLFVFKNYGSSGENANKLFCTSQKLYVSTNTICEHNIPDILFLRSFNLNSVFCQGKCQLSVFFYATNIPRSTVDCMYSM
jgi:hypothetical protein